ncbi:MAG: tail fiber protein [Aquabacterium sp.]|uniref:phage tail protein n=1 Tax=Aquabacterium sp. TaxID=1872578 RepID=UPI0025B9C79F|nr:tail fiber protein [Aquabacterium sp.]MBI3382828.1 tail fiber protein [Aquabacterium sp.]
MKPSSTLKVAQAWALGSACALISLNVQACSSEPIMASICVMAVPWTNLNGFQQANGALLAVSSNQALFSLIGTTYGGNGVQNFQLPDLRGRVIVGAGQGNGLPMYTPGQVGGANSVTLTTANVPLPAHIHGLNAGVHTVVTLGTLAAATTPTGLTATTTMTGVSATASASGLSLKGSSGNASSASASGGSLATPQSPANRIYASSAPDVTMASGSISGSATVTFTGNPTTTLTGNLTTTLSGQPAVTVNGNTDMNTPTGAMAPVSTMPPYLAMNVFIATQGIYPQRN